MSVSIQIAALFVETAGAYSNLPNVDPWDVSRDARKYEGPYPVIAHPPCNRWINMCILNDSRWKTSHFGNDGGCFKSALDSVNNYGGVLEHPAMSHAWNKFGLATPIKFNWIRWANGWVCEVWQSAYGHKANKATWLYYVGTREPFPMRWDRPRGVFQVGFHDQRGKQSNKPNLTSKEAKATPIDFRDELIRLAMYSGKML